MSQTDTSHATSLSAQLKLHAVVFIWGFTAILGKWITLPALPLVWHRLWISTVSIAIFTLTQKQHLRVSRLDAFKLLATGSIIAIHWLCFFHAIKIANVSVALSCLSSGAFFVALLEPLFFSRRIAKHEVICGLLACLALYFIFRMETRFVLGIVTALVAALTSALFAIINGKLAQRLPATVITLYEMLGGFIFLSCVLVCSHTDWRSALRLNLNDTICLLLLGIICTAWAQIMCVSLMKSITPYTLVLTVNLEPVYGIVMAYFLFGDAEKMSFGFYVGTALILAIIFANAVVKNRLLKLASSATT